MSVFDNFAIYQRIDKNNRSSILGPRSSWGPESARELIFSGDCSLNDYSFVAIGQRDYPNGDPQYPQLNRLGIGMDLEACDVYLRYGYPENADFRNLIIILNSSSNYGFGFGEIRMKLTDRNRRSINIIRRKESRQINVNWDTRTFVGIDLSKMMLMELIFRINTERFIVTYFDSLTSRSIILFIDRPINRFITFGRYRNRTYNYVLRHDKDYCNWILKTERNEDVSDEFLHFANYLKNYIQ